MNLLEINVLEFSAEFFILLILLLSFSFLLSYGNALSLAHAGFFVLGYGALLISFKFNIPFFAAMLVAALFSFALGYVLAASSLKFEIYFPVMGFAFAEIIRKISMTEIEGLGHGITRSLSAGSLTLIFLFSLLTYYSLTSILSSNFGRLLKALKEDRFALATIGENPEKLKTLLFLISSSFATISGSLYAYYIGFSYEHLLLSLLLISSAVLGGTKNLGIALAGLFLFLGYEALAQVTGGALIFAGLIWIVLIFFIIKSR